MNFVNTYNFITLSVGNLDCFFKKKDFNTSDLEWLWKVHCALTNWFSIRTFSKCEVRFPIQSPNCKIIKAHRECQK